MANKILILTVIVAVVAALIGFRVYQKRTKIGVSGYGFASTAEEVAKGIDLKGKVAIVTGANSGIGKETAKILALQGAHVFVMARTLSKANEAIAEIKAELNKEHGTTKKYVLSPLSCDLASLTSIQKAVHDFENLGLPLHFLINNAGIMGLAQRTPTQHGFETQIGVNHIGHFYLTNLLIDKLLQSKPSRVISVSSAAHRRANLSFIDDPNLETEYSAFGNYGNSKLANILHAREISERYSKQGVYAYSLHPGLIFTNIGQNLNFFDLLTIIPLIPSLKTIPEGTSTTIFTTLRAPVSESGLYYEDCNVVELYTPELRKAFEDPKVRSKLWKTTQRLIDEAVAKIK